MGNSSTRFQAGSVYFTGEIPNRYYFHVKERIPNRLRDPLNVTGVPLICDVYRTTAASTEQKPRVEHVADGLRVLSKQDKNDESFACRVGRNNREHEVTCKSCNKIELLALQHRELNNPVHGEMDELELAMRLNTQRGRQVQVVYERTRDRQLERGAERAIDLTGSSNEDNDEDNLLFLSSSDEDNGDDGVRGGEMKDNNNKRGPPDGAAASVAKRQKLRKLFAGLRF